MDKTLEELQQKLGYYFQNTDLLKKSLTHKSYVNEKQIKGIKHNERLEFFGDSALNLILSDYLFHKMPDCSEGDLTKIRAGMVNETSLSNIARELDLGKHLFLGKGEESSGGRKKNSLLANALEALIAALYIDSGYEQTYTVMIRILEDKIQHYNDGKGMIDFKSELQELVQNRQYPLPDYRHIQETGPDHEKKFHVELHINGEVSGYGEGRSKKEAEQIAASEALKKMNGKEE